MSLLPTEIKANNLKELFEKAIKIRKMVVEKKIVILNVNFTLSKAEFVQLCEIVSSRVEPFVSWDFGEVLELETSDRNENYIFSNEEVPLHWDGAFHEVPQILAFQCLENSVKKGRTIFVDTEEIISGLSKDLLTRSIDVEIKYTTEKVAHYGGEVKQKIIEVHPYSKKKVIRMGEEVKTKKNPVSRIVKDEDMKVVNDLQRYLKDDLYRYHHEWKKGDILFADNLSLLHGREEVKVNGKGNRSLRRIQIR